MQSISLYTKQAAASSLRKDLPPYVFIISMSHQNSFKKWCSSGVISAISCHEIIDFTGFSGTSQDTAVAYE